MNRDIAVMGSGYVGLVAGACLAELGHRVIGIDIDEQRVQSLQKGNVPIYEPGLETLVRDMLEEGRLSFTGEWEKALSEVDIIFIAVGTPKREDGSCDIRYVVGAAEMIGQTLTDDATVAVKSTVPVGTGELVHEKITEELRDRFPVEERMPDVRIVSNPEFLREGAALSDFQNPDRIVVGSESSGARDEIAALYEPLDANVIQTGLRTAEMIKYASNAMLAAKISFINEIANVCELVGADVEQVARAVGSDHRINPEFLGAGIGYGGSCFPKDTEALVQIAGQGGYHSQILSAVMAVNRQQRSRFARKILRYLPSASNRRTVGVWGLSFKPNTDDMREAPSIEIIQTLQTDGVEVVAYDPVAMDNARSKLSGIRWADDPIDAARDADAVALLTEWSEFLEVDFEEVKTVMNTPRIFDGRNALPMDRLVDLGFEYYGVGRGVDRMEDVLPKHRLLPRDESAASI